LTMLPYAMIGFAAGQQQRMLMSPMIEGSVNLVVSLIGVRVFGAMGVVAGTLIGAIVGVWLHFAISIPATDAITVSRRSLFWQGLFKPIACVVPAVAIALMAVQWTTSIFERVAVVTLTGITVLFLLGAANFSKPELLQMRRLFSFPELCAKSAKV
jgi:hypothetical protein